MRRTRMVLACILTLSMLTGILTSCDLVSLLIDEISTDSGNEETKNYDTDRDWEKEERPDRDNENEDGEGERESESDSETKNEEKETNNESGNAQVKYVYFGEYPQTLKADSVTVGADTDSRGYYLGSDGAYYAKVTAKPHYTGYTYAFSTGEKVVSGTEYYFKVEPIRWRVLSENGDTALVLCDSIVAAGIYDSSENNDNNYADSDVRTWLSDMFYQTAFTDFERELIVTTVVDNSAATTGDTSNQHTCENTRDRIFLLSYAEATDSNNGFLSHDSKDELRQMLTTDYARATGAFMTHSGEFLGYGYWWLRSPRSDDVEKVHVILDNGKVSPYENSGASWLDMMGVVPAMQIKLQDINK